MHRYFVGFFLGVLVMGAVGFGLERAVFGPPGEAELRETNAAWEREFRAEVLRRLAAERQAEDCSLRLIGAELRVLELREQNARLNRALTPGWDLGEDAARREQMKRRPPVIGPGDTIPPTRVPER